MIQAKSKEQLEKEAKALLDMLIKQGYSKEFALIEVYKQTGIKLQL